MSLRVRIILILRLIRIYLLFLPVNIEISKIRISFFQILPSGLIRRKILKYAIQSKCKMIINLRQIPV